jgi:hypothetical protein
MRVLDLARKAAGQLKTPSAVPQPPPPRTSRDYEINEINEKSPLPDVADLTARIDRAQAEPWRTQAERNVLEIVRGLVARYAATNDLVLLEVPGWLEQKLSGWRHAVTK